MKKFGYAFMMLVACGLGCAACTSDDDAGSDGTEGVVTGTVLETDEIHVPKEGGVYKVGITTGDNLYTEVPPQIDLDDVFGKDDDDFLDVEPSTSVSVDSYYSSSLYEDGFLANSAMSVSVEVRNKTVFVVVGPAKSKAERTKEIPFYNREGKVAARLLVRQDGDPDLVTEVPRLGNAGVQAVSAMANNMAQAFESYIDLEAYYVGWSDDPRWGMPLRPEDPRVSECWTNFYKLINYNLNIQRADLAQAGCYVDYLAVFRAWAYYQLVTFWGNVPFIPEDGYEPGDSLEQLSPTEMLPSIERSVKAACGGLDEKPGVALATDVNDFLFVSRDVARAVLAYTYMCMGEWGEAETLWEELAGHGFYALAPYDGEYHGGNDWVFGVWNSNQEPLPVLTYTDVILSLAECKWHTGDKVGALTCVQDVARENGLDAADGSPESIRDIRSALRLPGYFAFLKRNGMAQAELHLEDYQLLFPIPYNDVLALGGMIVQNPEY